MSYIDEQIFISDYIERLRWILTVERVVYEPLSVKKVLSGMVNRNYSLGFNVNRNMLEYHMSRYSGFYVINEANIESHTKILLPYPDDADLSEIAISKKRKEKHHSFMIYDSGHVVQSSPGGKEMENAYYIFRQIIENIKPYIEYTPAIVIKKCSLDT